MLYPYTESLNSKSILVLENQVKVIVIMIQNGLYFQRINV